MTARKDPARSLAAHVKWSRIADRSAATAPARRALEDRFVREARALAPDASDAQVAAMAESARKAYYRRLSLAGVEARRKRAS